MTLLATIAAALTTASPFTLELSAPTHAEFGSTITLRGRIVPALVGAPVAIERDGAVIGTATTRADGTFTLRTAVESPATYRARGGELVSATVSPRVRPRLGARFAGVGAVGTRLRLVARVEPAAPLRVQVWRNGRLVVDRTAEGAARIGLSTRRAARLQAEVTVAAAGRWAEARATPSRTVVHPRLALGARGPSVRALEERLRALRYALPRADGVYDAATYQAVLAFQKVERLPWTGRVDGRVWRRLQSAHVPHARFRGNHIEVSKGRQYLLVVRGGRVTSIVHVSTGATGNTPLGRWRIYRKVAGWDWVLWYPMYFLRGFAIHGYPSVPAYPASHGCVRVPMWLAPSLYSRYGYGATIYVY